MNGRVSAPVVLPLSLLAWVVVTMGLFVHFRVLWALVLGAVLRVKHFFGVNAVLGRQAERSFTLLGCLGPHIVSLVRLAKRFTLYRLVLLLHSIVELIGEPCEVLSFDHSVDMVRAEHGFAVSVVFAAVDPVVLESGVHLNLAWLNLGKLAVLADVRRRAGVAGLFVREEICADALVCVVAPSGNEFASVPNGRNRVRPNFVNGWH